MGLLSVLVLFLTALFCHTNAQYRGTVRLVRSGVFSSSYTAGIVEVYYTTSSSSILRWGNICYDSSFASTEASVICNQLGYNGASTYGRAGNTLSYGTDTVATILDDVNCFSSSYLTLEQCSLSTLIKSSCTSDSYDAYVSCYSTRIWNNPYSGQIRLQGGTYSSFGRLEVYCNGQWGTVCDDSVGATDARVACRQLGYSDYSTYTGNLAGSSSQPIWLDNVVCSSSYSCFAYCEACPSSQFHNCFHTEDVALGCEFSSFYTTSTNTLSTCQYADSISSVSDSIGAIIGGVVAAVFICCVLIITIPICICCCLGVGVGAAARGGRSSAKTTVVGGSNDVTCTAVTSQSTAYPQSGYDTSYPPQQGYAPAPQQGYAPQPGYAPAPQQGYPPQQDYPPQQGYAPQQGYPMQEDKGYGYPPQ